MQSCCSPIVSASAATPRLHPLQLLLPDCIRFSCCSSIASIRFNCSAPACDCFSCCSLIVSASTTAPRLHPSCSGRFQLSAMKVAVSFSHANEPKLIVLMPVSTLSGRPAHQRRGPPAPRPLRGQSGHRLWGVPGAP